MSDTQNLINEQASVPFVIACGDEGVQINHGRRFAFLGAGLKMTDFSNAIKALRDTLSQHGFAEQAKGMAIVANEENAYVKQILDLNDFDEANASMQQHLQVVAEKEQLLYAGMLPFADPLELEYSVKGHMVRPKGIHIANKICFTVGGGENTYNLGQYLISADWITQAPLDVAKAILATQVEFYEKLAKRPLLKVIETAGILPEEVSLANRQVLSKLGYNFS
jgi:hypothetical protein